MSHTPTSADPILADVVNDDLRAAAVFERFGLDYCCGGHQTLVEACARRSVDPEAVRAALKTLGPATDADKLPVEWNDLDQLTRYIVDHHHTYVTSSIPSINSALTKMVEKHGDRHPELIPLRATFRALGDELLVHLMKEENLLFPAIDEMARRRRGIENGAPMFATVLHPVRVMEDDHQEAGALIEQVRVLSGGHFTPPEDACTTYMACFAELERFERDLHRHIHLENNVLFPRALELERLVG